MTLLYRAAAETVADAIRATRPLVLQPGRTTARPVISPLEWLVDPPPPHSVGQTIQIHHYGAAQGNNDSNQIFNA